MLTRSIHYQLFSASGVPSQLILGDGSAVGKGSKEAATDVEEILSPYMIIRHPYLDPHVAVQNMEVRQRMVVFQ